MEIPPWMVISLWFHGEFIVVDGDLMFLGWHQDINWSVFILGEPVGSTTWVSFLLNSFRNKTYIVIPIIHILTDWSLFLNMNYQKLRDSAANTVKVAGKTSGWHGIWMPMVVSPSSPTVLVVSELFLHYQYATNSEIRLVVWIVAGKIVFPEITIDKYK